jgi:hypothetical protein
MKHALSMCSNAPASFGRSRSPPSAPEPRTPVCEKRHLMIGTEPAQTTKTASTSEELSPKTRLKMRGHDPVPTESHPEISSRPACTLPLKLSQPQHEARGTRQPQRQGKEAYPRASLATSPHRTAHFETATSQTHGSTAFSQKMENNTLPGAHVPWPLGRARLLALDRATSRTTSGHTANSLNNSLKNRDRAAGTAFETTPRDGKSGPGNEAHDRGQGLGPLAGYPTIVYPSGPTFCF